MSFIAITASYNSPIELAVIALICPAAGRGFSVHVDLDPNQFDWDARGH